MAAIPQLIDGKLNPKWIKIVWEPRASQIKDREQKLSGELLLDGLDFSLLENFDLDRYLSLAPAKSLERARLSGVRLRADSLKGSSLQGCDLRGAVFHRSISGSITISGCNLTRAKGLWGDQKPLWGSGLSDYRQNPPLLRYAVLPFKAVDLPAWASIRSLGNLPLFGVSNFALLFLLIYAGFGRWYNAQLSSILNIAQSQSGSDFIAVISQFRLVPKPWPFGLLFVSILALSVASGLFAIRCPDPVKDYSAIQWEVGGREMLEYRAANFDRPISRWVCFIFYVFGGAIAIPYAIYRAFLAVAFFFS